MNENKLRHRKKHLDYVSYFLTADKQTNKTNKS